MDHYRYATKDGSIAFLNFSRNPGNARELPGKHASYNNPWFSHAFSELMMYSKEKVMDIAGFEIIKVTENESLVRYFAQKGGKAFTKELPSIDAVRGELELLEARKSSEWVSEVLPHGPASLVHPQSIIMYMLGKLLLRLLTIGKYPKQGKPHNVDFVTMFPGYVLFAIFVVITVVYS